MKVSVMLLAAVAVSLSLYAAYGVGWLNESLELTDRIATMHQDVILANRAEIVRLKIEIAELQVGQSYYEPMAIVVE